MALSYPLSTAQFFDTLPIRHFSMKPADARTFSETGGGEVIAAERGQRLWTGQITLDIDDHDIIASVDAMLAMLEDAAGSFLMYDPRKEFPIADPGGTQISGASPQISSLDGNNKELRINGLPAGYQLRTGDLVGWTYGANPLRYALHRIAVGSTASGAGLSGQIEVRPHIRQGATAGAAVSLVRPVFKAKVPSADYGAGRAYVSEGGSFSFVQTLR